MCVYTKVVKTGPIRSVEPEKLGTNPVEPEKPGTGPVEPEKPVRAKNRDKTGPPTGQTGNPADPVPGYPVLAFFSLL